MLAQNLYDPWNCFAHKTYNLLLSHSLKVCARSTPSRLLPPAFLGRESEESKMKSHAYFIVFQSYHYIGTLSLLSLVSMPFQLVWQWKCGTQKFLCFLYPSSMEQTKTCPLALENGDLTVQCMNYLRAVYLQRPQMHAGNS